MFRTVFKSAVRQAAMSRAHSTRATPRARNISVGVALAASSLVFLPFASIENEADKAKVESDKKSTKIGKHEGKSTYRVEDSSNKPSEVIPEDHPQKSAKKKGAERATEEASKKAEKETAEKEEKRENELTEKTEKGETEENDAAEGEGEQSAAYNPETGEINWDCPCLGGMAHGPCGEEFKAAFSCFIYSETEPKGIDCIQKFEGMRTCFRQHPEHYKEELYEDDEPVPQVENEDPKEPATEDISKVA